MVDGCQWRLPNLGILFWNTTSAPLSVKLKFHNNTKHKTEAIILNSTTRRAILN